MNQTKYKQVYQLPCVGLVTEKGDGKLHKENKNNVQYIILRGNSKEKVLETIDILIKKMKIKLVDSPRTLLPIIADGYTKEILKSDIKNSCKFAVVLSVSISNIPEFLKELKKVKIPSHLVLVTTKYYKVYIKIRNSFKNLNVLR